MGRCVRCGFSPAITNAISCLDFICMAEGGLPVIVKCVVRTSASGETAALELSFDRGPMLINRCARLSVSVRFAFAFIIPFC